MNIRGGVAAGCPGGRRLLGGLAVGVLARRLAPGRLLGASLVGFAVVAAVGWNGPHVTAALVFYLAAFVVAGVPG